VSEYSRGIILGDELVFILDSINNSLAKFPLELHMMLLVPIFDKSLSKQLCCISCFRFFEFASAELSLLFDCLFGSEQQ
jgi:hypothetical protein